MSDKNLLIATDESTKFWGLLRAPSGFQTTHTTRWTEAVDLVMYRSFDVIVATYPFSDKPFKLFVHAVRSKASLSNRAGLVVLTTPDQKTEAMHFIGNGVNRVVSIDDSSDLHRAIDEVIDVSPRRAARLMVRLQMPFGDRNCTIHTFSENISTSGMFLGTSNQLEIGRKIDFEFTLPESSEIVRGQAEVVRHASDPDARRPGGIGIRFLRFEDQSSAALSSFLEEILTAD